MSNATINAEPVRTPTAAGTGSALVASTRAELLRLRKWPAFWVMVGVWLLLNLTFAYVFDYISYATGSASFASEGVATDSLLAGLFPEAVPGLLTTGMPMFGGAIMLILGALTVGSGYGWGTWKTVLTQGPGRLSAFGGALVSLAIVVVGVVTATFALDLVASLIIATVESQPIMLPALGDAAQAFGGGLLIFGLWTSFGVLIGTVTRSPALAIGLGLVWTMAVENLLRGVSNLLSELTYVTDYLPGTAVGSLAASLGAGSESESGGAPGVFTILDGTPAALLAAAYIAAFTVVALVLIRRRDVP